MPDLAVQPEGIRRYGRCGSAPGSRHRTPGRRRHVAAAETRARGLSGEADRTAAVWAGSHPTAFSSPSAKARGWRKISYREFYREPRVSLPPCSNAIVARTADGDPVRQLYRPRAGRVGALYAGIPFARSRRPIRWSREISGSSRYLMNLLTPGLLFAADGDRFAPAIGPTFRRARDRRQLRPFRSRMTASPTLLRAAASAP